MGFTDPFVHCDTVASFLFMLLMLKEVIYLVVLIHGDCVNKHTCDKLFCMRFILVFLITVLTFDYTARKMLCKNQSRALLGVMQLL